MKLENCCQRLTGAVARVVWCGCVVLLAAALAGGAPAQKKKPAAKASSSAGASSAGAHPAATRPAAAPDVVMPFRSGEQLQFRVLWSKFSVNAALVKFLVVEHRDFFGHSAWHFRLTAQTIQTTRLLYALDDQFDSYTDAAHLQSLQFEMYLTEQGKQQSNVWRLAAPGDAAPASVNAARVAAGTRDPVGLFYVLRGADWKRTPEMHVPVFDGPHEYDIVARLGQTGGQVAVPAGMFTASRIDIRVFEHGQEMTDTHFSLWLAENAARTPVLLEAEAPAPFGSARVELTSAQ
jgi:hypothetical protein